MEKKSSRNKILKNLLIIIYAFIIVVVIFFIFLVIDICTTTSDIRDIPRSIEFDLTVTDYIDQPKEEINDLKYYETLDEAIKNESMIGELSDQENVKMQELKRIERYPYLILLCSFDKDTSVGVYIFQMEKGKYSQPISIQMVEINQKESLNQLYKSPGGYHYEEEDCIAEDIKEQLIFFNISKYNDGLPFVYGSSADARIKNLTILGQAPTEIIPIMHDGKEHYLWYYSDLDFVEPLSQNIDFSDFTYQQMIDCLQISLED